MWQRAEGEARRPGGHLGPRLPLPARGRSPPPLVAAEVPWLPRCEAMLLLAAGRLCRGDGTGGTRLVKACASSKNNAGWPAWPALRRRAHAAYTSGLTKVRGRGYTHRAASFER